MLENEVLSMKLYRNLTALGLLVVACAIALPQAGFGQGRGGSQGGYSGNQSGSSYTTSGNNGPSYVTGQGQSQVGEDQASGTGGGRCNGHHGGRHHLGGRGQNNNDQQN